MTTSPSDQPKLPPEEELIPIAEIFTSIHGEGAYAGTPMTFIRLAGCSVGKNVGVRSANFSTIMPVLPSGKTAWECTAFDGRKFPCDTDFNVNERLTLRQILNEVDENVFHVCITGGEPLIHQDKEWFVEMCKKLWKKGYRIHIETSGTIVPSEELMACRPYIACSPKARYIDGVVTWADEVRLMVDHHFDIGAARKILLLRSGEPAAYLAPLSMSTDTTKIDPASMKECMILLRDPIFWKCRVSIQMHKVLGVR